LYNSSTLQFNQGTLEKEVWPKGKQRSRHTKTHAGIQIRNKTETNFVAFSPQANYTDRQLPQTAKLMPTFAGRERCVVSETDPYGR
jgi:hypothetical protein